MAPIVHTYRSGETGLFVNSYLIEGADGVVAIDAPLLVSDGRAFRARLETLNKPLLGVLITHPHPDHYNTIGELLAGENVPVIAHRDVDREIRDKDEAKRTQWGPTFGEERPASAMFPDRAVADEESVELDDLRFTAWDFGACESESETVWLLDDGDTWTWASPTRTRTTTGPPGKRARAWPGWTRTPADRQSDPGATRP